MVLWSAYTKTACDFMVSLLLASHFWPANDKHTFLPQMENAILPPSSSPAGMLLMELISSPAHAHITRGFKDIGVPSLSAVPRRSFAGGWGKK